MTHVAKSALNLFFAKHFERLIGRFTSYSRPRVKSKRAARSRALSPRVPRRRLAPCRAWTRGRRLTTTMRATTHAKTTACSTFPTPTSSDARCADAASRRKSRARSRAKTDRPDDFIVARSITTPDTSKAWKRGKQKLFRAGLTKVSSTVARLGSRMGS